MSNRVRENRFLNPIVWALLLFLLTGTALASHGTWTPNDRPPGPPEKDPCEKPECCGGNGGRGSGGGSGGGSGPPTSSPYPISYFTGAERPFYMDIAVKGVFSIRFHRRYNSQSTYDSPLGYGWSHNHDRRLYEYPDDTIIIRHRCGSRTKFVHSGGAYITESGGLLGTLEEQVDGSYILHYFNGTKDYFDAQGRLTAAEDVRGNRLEYQYSSTRMPLVGTSPYGVDPAAPLTVSMTWQLLSIQERLADGVLSGNQLTLSYSPTTGRLQSITDQDGRTVTYTHDLLNDSEGNPLTAGNLVQVDGLEGVVSSYTYEDSNDNHNLTGIRNDATAEWIVNNYNESDRVVSQTYGTHTTTFDYVTPYIETEVTETIVDADGQNPVDIVSRYCFDDLGYATEIQDAEGYLTVYKRNSDYLVTRKERWTRASDLSDIVCDITADTANREMVHAIDDTYNTDKRHVTREEDRGDGSTITTTKTYDGAWVASMEVVSSDDPTTVFRTEYTFYYDSNNNPTNIKDVIRKRRVEDGGDQTITYAYNNRGQAVSITYPDNTSLNFIYENGNLFPTRSYFKDASGVAQTDLAEDYTYDSRGNRKTVTDAASKTTSYDYDDRNRLVKVTNPLTEQTIYTYSGNNLAQIEIGHKESPATQGEFKKIIYDSRNRISQMQILQNDSSWRTMSTNTYDSRNRQLSITDANGNSSTFTYDKLGRMLSSTDAEQHTTLFDYDALGRRTKSTQTATTPYTVVEYSYDRQGNLLSVTDPNGHITSYSYDAVGNRLSQVSPDTGTTSYVYDTIGNLQSKTDANNDTTDYSYDARNRLTDVVYADSSLNIQYGYNGLGQMVSVIDAAGSTTYDYDTRGNLTDVGKVFGAVTLNTIYGYDDANRMTSITYPSGKRIDYALDNLGRVIGATQTDGATVTQLADNISYQPLGPRVAMDLGNSFQQNRIYDDAYRLTGITMPSGDPNASQDTDGDGIEDASDNCPFTSNADQQDSGGLATSAPDGIGDACQCGDVNNSGIVDNTDAIIIKRYMHSLPPGVDLNKCNVSSDSACDNTDAILIQRALHSMPPGLTQSCPAANASQ